MKKELYYIRGNAERADEVKAALLEKYPGTVKGMAIDFSDNRCIFFVHGMSFDSARINGLLYCFIVEYGTELHLTEVNKQEFKVGDVVTRKDSDFDLCQIVSDTKDDDIHIYRNIANGINNFRLATEEEINEWNEKTLRPKNLHYSKVDHVIERYFLPFDNVLVRDSDRQPWLCDIFSLYDVHSGNPFICIFGCWKQCIPYNEKTAHLIGTKDNFEKEEL